jgi:hypothetical protein
MPYGIAIKSQRSLPSWLSGHLPGDRELLIEFDPPRELAPGSNVAHTIGRQETILRWDDGVIARISDGSRAMISAPDALAPELIHITIAGPVLGVVLYQLGDLVLHASAVRYAGKAVALLGASSEGKSTLAALLYMAGWPMISDDLVPVSPREEPITRAGYPLMKLSPASAALVDIDPDRLIPLDAGSGKGGLPANDGFVEGEFPFAALYVLANGSLGIEELSPAEAVTEIVRATYVAHLLRSVKGRREHFETATRLVRRVPVRRLRRGASTEVGRLPALLEGDLSSFS